MRRMRLELLLLLAGALAVPDLPLPLLLYQPEEDAALPRLLCIAPRRFAGSTFQLASVGTGASVLNVSVEPDQHQAEFTLDGTPRCYRCRYRSYNGSAWSAFSAEVAVNVPDDGGCHPPASTESTGTDRPLPTSITLRQGRSWLLPVAVGAAGLVLLLLAAVVAWRGSSWRAGRSDGATARSFAMTPSATVPA